MANLGFIVELATAAAASAPLVMSYLEDKKAKEREKKERQRLASQPVQANLPALPSNELPSWFVPAAVGVTVVLTGSLVYFMFVRK